LIYIFTAVFDNVLPCFVPCMVIAALANAFTAYVRSIGNGYSSVAKLYRIWCYATMGDFTF